VTLCGTPLRVLDLFAGVGGFSLGFEEALTRDGSPAYELVCAVDNEHYACETLRQHVTRAGRNPSIAVEGDLTQVSTHERVLEQCKGGIDVIIGGPPCQSFSTIGTRAAARSIRARWKNDNRDHLYLEYVRLVEDLKPTFLVFENVTGITTKKNGDSEAFVDVVADRLQELGYELRFRGLPPSRRHVILNAADYGVPQIRHRVFLIGNRLGLLNLIPPPSHSPVDRLVPGITLPYVTLRDAIGDLPPVRSPYTPWGLSEAEREYYRAENTKLNRGSENARYHWNRFHQHYSQVGESGRGFLDFIRPRSKDELLTGHVARGHQRSDIELFRSMPEGFSSKQIWKSSDPEIARLKKLIKYDMHTFKDKYKKQAWDRPCSTVFAHMQKDGNRFIHPDSSQARTLTVREAARVQSFPDWFHFAAPGNIRYRLIGNAVPPLLARAIALALLQLVDGDEYLWETPS